MQVTNNENSRAATTALEMSPGAAFPRGQTGGGMHVVNSEVGTMKAAARYLLWTMGQE